jgi:hypothetical protein
VGRLATICVLLDDTNVNNAPSRCTTGEPDVGSRSVPMMVICLVVEFMVVLTMVGVCAWTKAAELISQAAAATSIGAFIRNIFISSGAHPHAMDFHYLCLKKAAHTSCMFLQVENRISGSASRAPAQTCREGGDPAQCT